MKNNLIWVAVILVVVILAAIYIGSGSNSYQASTENATTTQVSNTKTTVKSSTNPTLPLAGMNTSLGGIFSIKGNYQCDYEAVSPQGRASNVVYLSDGKMRGEFRTTGAFATNNNITVYDGKYLYVWTEGFSTGKVTEPKTLADLPGIIPQDVSSGRILGTSANNVSWNCHAWLRDASKLTRPSYVTFY